MWMAIKPVMRSMSLLKLSQLGVKQGSNGICLYLCPRTELSLNQYESLDSPGNNRIWSSYFRTRSKADYILDLCNINFLQVSCCGRLGPGLEWAWSGYTEVQVSWSTRDSEFHVLSIAESLKLLNLILHSSLYCLLKHTHAYGLQDFCFMRLLPKINCMVWNPLSGRYFLVPAPERKGWAGSICWI